MIGLVILMRKNWKVFERMLHEAWGMDAPDEDDDYDSDFGNWGND